MGTHRVNGAEPPAPPPECTYPAGRHLLAWTGEVATAPNGQLVGRWACRGGNCDHAEPRVISIDAVRTIHPPLIVHSRPDIGPAW